MEILNTIFEYVQLASLVVAVASAIASVTETPKDDKWVAKAYKIIDALAINIGKAKQK
jgi:hypothetical protein